MTHDFTRYDSTVNYLYGLQKHGIKLGLANTLKLMDILGKPHNSFNSVHIAGTNGKGSTAAAVASILKENGFRTGLFTSPHLVSFTERIQINNQQISETDVIDLASTIRRLISGEDINPTFFEFVTAMAFYFFEKQKIDWAVVETGMGGRLDATNVLAPHVTVITNISLDHSEFLGNTISKITYEKAGIIKPRVPVITSSLMPEVITQLINAAAGCNAGIHIYDRDFKGMILNMDESRMTMNYSGYTSYSNLSVPVTGQHQLYNICMAIRTCELLRSGGLLISDTSIAKGLQNMRIEGRLEKVSSSPPVYLDGAHNPEATRSLAASVKRLFPDKKIIIVAGIMDDKDKREILVPLCQTADSMILTRAKYERAASPAKLMDLIKSIRESETAGNPSRVEAAHTVAEALNLAKSQCHEKGIILVTGSFYTIGEAKEALGCTGVLSRLRESSGKEEEQKA